VGLASRKLISSAMSPSAYGAEGPAGSGELNASRYLSGKICQSQNHTEVRDRHRDLLFQLAENRYLTIHSGRSSLGYHIAIGICRSGSGSWLTCEVSILRLAPPFCMKSAKKAFTSARVSDLSAAASSCGLIARHEDIRGALLVVAFTPTGDNLVQPRIM
jgi:hypothetical protein